MAAVYKVEQDWLFENLLGKLETNRHLVLSADQGWGLREYINELGFHLSERNPDIRICYVDMKSAEISTSLQELFLASLSSRFPEVTSLLARDRSNLDALKLPELISKSKRVRVALFLENSHLLHRLKDARFVLKTLKLKLKNQKDCIFCLSGNNTHGFRSLVKYPGPLSGLGQKFELKHNPLSHRSASVRKLFHDHGKNIGKNTAIQMSFMVDNHPQYLKLLAWHALIRTPQTCTLATVENALNDLIQHYDYYFLKIVEQLTPKQLNFLRAHIDGNKKHYSIAIRDEYQLGSTSNVARIISCLEKKEIIYHGNRCNVFTDPLFKEWLRKRYFT